MTSGVYQLTFSSGDTYIGKSINIEERWKQHTNKMYKGTAAKNMQAAFRMCGAPMGRILVECHEDHIDVVESCFIARHNPTLNSDRPKDPFPDLTGEQCDYLFSTFVHSARDLVAMKLAQEEEATKKQKSLNKGISTLEKTVTKLKVQIIELENLNDDLLRKRSEEELNADISKRISTMQIRDTCNLSRIFNQEQELIKLNKEMHALSLKLEWERRPWWKKIFN